MQKIVAQVEFIDGVRVITLHSLYSGKSIVITEDVNYRLTVAYKEDKKDANKTS